MLIQQNFGTISPVGDSDNKEIGRRLGALRQALGLNQVTIARRLNLGPNPGGPQKWNNWEHGRDRLKPPDATKICILTGVDLDYIYRGLMDHVPPDLIDKILEILQGSSTRPRKPPRMG